MSSPNIHSGHHMDHSEHGANHGSDVPSMPVYSSEHASSPSFQHEMMKMYFHFGLGDTLLFKSFVTQDPFDLWLACAIFFTIAVFYEGLKCFREKLLRRAYASGFYQVSTINQLIESGPTSSIFTANGDGQSNLDRSGGGGTNGSPAEPRLVQDSSYGDLRTRHRHCRRMLSAPHMLQALLHMLQVAISYTLMLGFMTFNVCLCFAILAGAGIGYFLFCWRKLTYVPATEHCH